MALFASAVLFATFTAVPVQGSSPSAKPAVPPPATSAPATPAPTEPAPTLDPKQLDALLASGDTTIIAQRFKRHPGEVLPFIDEYLEGGLAMIEKAPADAAAAQRALDSWRRGIKYAEIANQAFGEVVFVEYAAAFAGWTPQEQLRFREAQKEFRESRQKSKDSPADAIAGYRRSLAIADGLGDYWGVAMNQLAIAQASKELGRMQEGHDAALKAMELFGRLQLRPSYIKSLLTCAELRQALQYPDNGVGQYRMALQMLPNDAKPEQRKAIVDPLIAALEKIGRKDEADKLRAAEEAR